MAMTTAGNSGAPILASSDVNTLVVQPALRQSVAAAVCTVVRCATTTYRIPVVQADPTAAWVAEGSEISPSDATLAEVDVTPRKLAGLTIISRELADDSNPAAALTVGEGLARDLARKLDAAFFAATTTNGPAGIAGLSGVGAVSAGTSFTSTDAFADALSAAEQVGATITSFVANPADALALAKVKKATGSNEPLLATSNTEATQRTILGVQLLVSPAVTAGTIWGIPRDRVVLVIRDDARLEVDSSVYFTSDRTAIKATMRAGIGFPHPAAIAKVSRTA